VTGLGLAKRFTSSVAFECQLILRLMITLLLAPFASLPLITTMQQFSRLGYISSRSGMTTNR
jgi:hypothetical protein